MRFSLFVSSSTVIVLLGCGGGGASGTGAGGAGGAGPTTATTGAGGSGGSAQAPGAASISATFTNISADVNAGTADFVGDPAKSHTTDNPSGSNHVIQVKGVVKGDPDSMNRSLGFVITVPALVAGNQKFAPPPPFEYAYYTEGLVSQKFWNCYEGSVDISNLNGKSFDFTFDASCTPSAASTDAKGTFDLHATGSGTLP